MAAARNVPLPRPRPRHASRPSAAAPPRQGTDRWRAAAAHVPLPPARPADRGRVGLSPRPASACAARCSPAAPRFKPLLRPTAGPFAIAPTAATSAADIAALKRVIEAARKGKAAEADATDQDASPIRSRASSPNG